MAAYGRAGISSPPDGEPQRGFHHIDRGWRTPLACPGYRPPTISTPSPTGVGEGGRRPDEGHQGKTNQPTGVGEMASRASAGRRPDEGHQGKTNQPTGVGEMAGRASAGASRMRVVREKPINPRAKGRIQARWPRATPQNTPGCS